MRSTADDDIARLFSHLPRSTSVQRTEISIARAGAPLMARWYDQDSRRSRGFSSAVVYLHGGGLVAGSVELFDPVVSTYVEWTGVPFLAIDYRLAPSAHSEEPSLDAFDALRWLAANAVRLGVDPNRIALMGDSAGGGIAASCAIRARDRNVAVAKQLLIYPMLDDRNTKATDPFIAPFVTWDHLDNQLSWRALLGDTAGTERVSPYSAAARCGDHTGLAPAYIEIGTLDLFRDESLAYATNLLASGVEVELHLHPGCTHDYDWLAPTSELARSWRPQRIAAIESI